MPTSTVFHRPPHPYTWGCSAPSPASISRSTSWRRSPVSRRRSSTRLPAVVFTPRCPSRWMSAATDVPALAESATGGHLQAVLGSMRRRRQRSPHERLRRCSRRPRERAAVRRGPPDVLPDHARHRVPEASCRRQGRRRRHLYGQSRRDARDRRRVGLRQVDPRRAASCGFSTRRRARSCSTASDITNLSARRDAPTSPRACRWSSRTPMRRSTRASGRVHRRRAAEVHDIAHGRRAQAARSGAARDRRAQPGALQPLPARVLRRPAAAHRHRAGPGGRTRS